MCFTIFSFQLTSLLIMYKPLCSDMLTHSNTEAPVCSVRLGHHDGSLIFLVNYYIRFWDRKLNMPRQTKICTRRLETIHKRCPHKTPISLSALPQPPSP